MSRADELFYGGAAGGGKTDLLLGLAAELHQRSVIFRRVFPLLEAVIYRAEEIIDDAHENKSEHSWKWDDGRLVELGAVQYEDDKKKWQGRPHDLKAFDEVTEFTKSQYEFICGWNRTTTTGQRVRVVCTGNPPTDDTGLWIFERFGAWLDDKHPHPAKPGELRWYATIEGEEKEFLNGDPIHSKDGPIYPRSRTFIPARLSDNPFLSKDSVYRAVLQALPEPLRSQMLDGDFHAASVADPWQIVPTDWVRAAQRRWLERARPDTPMSAVGIDPARGGNDNMSMSRRYDNWFDKIIFWPGAIVQDGPTGAMFVKQALGDMEPLQVNIDVGGVGSSTFDSLKVMYNANAINFAGASEYHDKSGKLKMRNMRSELYWRMRDALDPTDGDNIALPPGNEIVADLCSARYKLTTAGVQVEEKEEIKKRLGRSPDKGESILLANYINPPVQVFV